MIQKCRFLIVKTRNPNRLKLGFFLFENSKKGAVKLLTL